MTSLAISLQSAKLLYTKGFRMNKLTFTVFQSFQDKLKNPLRKLKQFYVQFQFRETFYQQTLKL